MAGLAESIGGASALNWWLGRSGRIYTNLTIVFFSNFKLV